MNGEPTMTIEKALRKLRRKGYKVAKSCTMAQIQLWAVRSPEGHTHQWSSGYIVQEVEKMDAEKKG